MMISPSRGASSDGGAASGDPASNTFSSGTLR
jgi:hypothetical protein